MSEQEQYNNTPLPAPIPITELLFVDETFVYKIELYESSYNVGIGR